MDKNKIMCIGGCGGSCELQGQEKPSGAVVMRSRQGLAMIRAARGLGHVIDGLKVGVPVDIAVSDLEEIRAFLIKRFSR